MRAFKVTIGNSVFITFAHNGAELIDKLPDFNGRSIEDLGMYAVDEEQLRHKGLTIYPYKPVLIDGA